MKSSRYTLIANSSQEQCWSTQKAGCAQSIAHEEVIYRPYALPACDAREKAGMCSKKYHDQLCTAQAAKALKGVSVQRITFTEVTSKAVRDALAAPRTVNQALVDAYLARRALDYLFGFTLSPVLWRKLPGCKSAGEWHSHNLAVLSACNLH